MYNSYVLLEDSVHVKTKWVRVNKGIAEHPQVRCRFVAQELALGEKLDELFAGTPSKSAVRLLLLHSRQNGRCIMTMDVKTAFLYGVVRRKVYIELPRRDPWSTDGKWVGNLERALYGTRDAPQIWQQEVSDSLTKLGFQRSVFQPSVFVHQTRNLAVVIHVDDFLCSGQRDDLLWMYDELYQEFFGCEPACRLFTDASACKGMLLRQGSGKIKHFSTKQLWAHGAIQSYGISVVKIPRALNAADALTHSLTVKEMATHLKCLGLTRP